MTNKILSSTKARLAIGALVIVTAGLLGWMCRATPSWENQGTVVGVRTVHDQHDVEFLKVTVKDHTGQEVNEIMPLTMGPCWNNAIFQTRDDDNNQFGADERCVRPTTN